jgi:hypothetical protein
MDLLLLRRAFHSECNGSTRPIVLLLGWLGCQERHLAKYASIYKDLRADVHMMRPSVLQTAIPTLSDRAISQYMERVAQSSLQVPEGNYVKNAPLRPVIAHCMSNAGWIAFGTLLCLLNQNRPLLSSTVGETSTQKNRHSMQPSHDKVLEIQSKVARGLCGIVVDSAPSLPTPSIWSRGMVSAVLKRPVDAIEDAYPMALRCANRAAERYLALPSVHQRLTAVRKAWLSCTTNIPQLYLYSSNDALIPCQHVESFMEQQRLAASSPIMGHRWSDSGHCEHLRLHPEEYRDRVKTFIEQCLRNLQHSNLHVT